MEHYIANIPIVVDSTHVTEMDSKYEIKIQCGKNINRQNLRSTYYMQALL